MVWELTKKQLDYAAKDAEILLPLQKILTKKVNNIDRFNGYDKEKNPDRPMLRKVARLECDVIIAVAEMEYNGMRINVEDWTTWVEELQAETNRLEKVLLSKLKLPQTMGQPLFHYGGAGFDQYQDKINVNSTTELLKIFKDMGIPVESTEFKAIASLAEKYPVLQDLLDYRKSYKGLTSFGQILEKINIITGGYTLIIGQQVQHQDALVAHHLTLNKCLGAKELEGCLYLLLVGCMLLLTILRLN